MTQPPADGLFSREDLVAQLAASLGIDKAKQAVAAVTHELGLEDRAHFDRTQMLAIFEALSQQDGIVGVVARFAKVRLILQK